MKLTIVSLVVIALSVAVAGDALAYSSQSKTAGHASHLCRDKLIPKNLKGQEYKTEKAKCMEDPTGYQ
jgi:hypothetical protein